MSEEERKDWILAEQGTDEPFLRAARAALPSEFLKFCNQAWRRDGAPFVTEAEDVARDRPRKIERDYGPWRGDEADLYYMDDDGPIPGHYMSQRDPTPFSVNKSLKFSFGQVSFVEGTLITEPDGAQSFDAQSYESLVKHKEMYGTRSELQPAGRTMVRQHVHQAFANTFRSGWSA